MTAERYAERQLAGICQRCTRDATDGQYCVPHAEAQRDYARRHAEQRRILFRDNGLCGECGRVPSETFRCGACEQRRAPADATQLTIDG